MTSQKRKGAQSATPGDASPKIAVLRDSGATRARILDAAKVLFSQGSYEGVGVREIAARARVDPALVIRYFGSKEGLFRAVAEQAFDAGDLLSDGVDALPQDLTQLLMGALDSEKWRTGYDPLRLLLGSIGSPTAGVILGEYLDRDFVGPLAVALKGRHARERAIMLGANIIGFALMRVALPDVGSRAPESPFSQKLLKAVLATIAAEA